MCPHLLSDEMIPELSPGEKQREYFDSGFTLPGSFGVRVGQGGKRAFFLIYSQDGRRRRYPIGAHPLISLAEARKKAEEILRDVQGGRNPAWELRMRRRSPTLAELANSYLVSAKQRELSERTISEYTRILDRNILPELGSKRAFEIRSEDAAALYREIAAGRGSIVMAQRSLRVLLSLLAYGTETAKLVQNPLKDWRIPEPPAVRPRKFEVTRLSFPDLLRLWVLLGEQDPAISGPFRMILLTAQKPSVILNMKWSHVRGELWYLQAPKKKSSRERPSVPFYLTPPAIQCLRSVQEHRRFAGLSSYVFATSKGTPRTQLRASAARLSKQLGLRRSFNPLSLRLTVRDNLFELGVRPDIVERILYPHLPDPGLKLGGGVNQHSYADEVREALIAWSKRLGTVTPLKPYSGPGGKSRGKVVSLFPKR